MKPKNHKYTNHLIHENSPYLLQHAHNPVNWYPWGEEALQKAKNENKLILVSIGYSACHWCHVMAHESFENEEIARLMNDNFVCIKVDREERPDVDNIYMTAVQLITGRGGWPLNCFALPDGRPVYGGTYFRPNDWKKVLVNLSESYKLDKTKFVETANNIQQGIQKSEIYFSEIKEFEFDFNKIKLSVNQLKSNFDEKFGGMNYSPKFQMPIFWSFLTEFSYYSHDYDIKKQVNLTIIKIAHGGIYDQLAGGFARYSVDAKWFAPHFEKMLYDNAQLISLYSKGYQITGNKLYQKVVFETLDFIGNEMTSKEGAFYSAYDADSEGEEGKFYVWNKNEISGLLKDESDFFCDYYNVTKTGNWENGTNILYVSDNSEKLFKKYHLSETQAEEKLSQLKQILLKERNKRVKPGLDDKILTAWNALMISAYADAYQVFGKKDYLQKAVKAAEFIQKKMMNKDYALKRSYKDGNAKINAFSDDYALSSEAFIKLYQVSGDAHYLLTAKELTDYLLKHFYDKNSGMFFYTSDNDAALTVRQKEISDNVIPASNSVIAKNLYMLGLYFTDELYLETAKKMIAGMEENTLSNINYFAGWASLNQHFSKPSYELVIIGKDYKYFAQKLLKSYRPDIIFAGSMKESNIPIFKDRYKEGETLIYVCKNNVCNQPVKTVKEAEKLLK
ncbi:MAG: thioredoxin domain-containing protein [Bacteroidales bacterium]|nr:thioredoxin domain-containing protein [Bacteroidales bacterium]